MCIGLWHFHRAAKARNIEWWIDASMYYQAPTVASLVETLVLRYMRRYKTPRYAGEFNALVDRVCAKFFLYENTRKAARLNCNSREPISINPDACRMYPVNFWLKQIKIKVISRACMYCGALCKENTHIHCGKRNCREIAAFTKGIHGLFGRPRLRDQYGIAAVAAFLKAKGNYYGKLKRGKYSTDKRRIARRAF